ncbi:MAG: TolC family protein [Rikenellaceae bacterium]
MKNRFLITLFAVANFATAALAQNSFSYKEFEAQVLDYSQHIKQSEAQREAMQSAMKLSKSAFYPAVDAAGLYQYRANESDLDFGTMAIPLDHNTFSTEIGVLQPIYAGGAVRTNYEASKIQSEMADRGVELTTDNIIFAAEQSYWGAAAQRAMYVTMCEYVDIITRLKSTIQDKYDDGMVAKTELIQMESRLKEAELQRSNSHLAYRLALQNLNSLMGRYPMEEITMRDSVITKMELPKYYSIAEIMERRPDYQISQLDVDYQQKQISLASASYRPSLAVGFKETWGTQMINIDGSTLFNSNLYASLSVPIFRGGARKYQRSVQTAILDTKISQAQDMEDQITKEIANSWTELSENINQIDIAEENCTLAEENLELNTFSYNEGKLQILDVLSAQVNWIQAYTNLIQSYYQQRISNATYQKAIGARYND